MGEDKKWKCRRVSKINVETATRLHDCTDWLRTLRLQNPLFPRPRTLTEY